MPNEPIQGLPYPTPGAPPAGFDQLKDLADAVAPRLSMRFATVTARDQAIPEPIDGMVATTGSGVNLEEWIVVGGAWVPRADHLLGGAWTPYTPSWTGVTVGNGTLDAAYRVLGKTLTGRVRLTLGSTSAVTGSVFVGLPPATPAGGSAYPTLSNLGNFTCFDTSASARRAGALFRSGSTAQLFLPDGTALSASSPWTWANGDHIFVSFTYEAA